MGEWDLSNGCVRRVSSTGRMIELKRSRSHADSYGPVMCCLLGKGIRALYLVSNLEQPRRRVAVSKALRSRPFSPTKMAEVPINKSQIADPSVSLGYYSSFFFFFFFFLFIFFSFSFI